MGIPGFNIWFNETYQSSYDRLGNVEIDHVYIDMNSILHNTLRSAR